MCYADVQLVHIYYFCVNLTQSKFVTSVCNVEFRILKHCRGEYWYTLQQHLSSFWVTRRPYWTWGLHRKKDDPACSLSLFSITHGTHCKHSKASGARKHDAVIVNGTRRFYSLSRDCCLHDISQATKWNSPGTYQPTQ